MPSKTVSPDLAFQESSQKSLCLIYSSPQVVESSVSQSIFSHEFFLLMQSCDNQNLRILAITVMLAFFQEHLSKYEMICVTVLLALMAQQQ